MIEAIQTIFYQLGVALYQITSLHVGNYDVGGTAQIAVQGFLDSTFLRIVEIILAPITVALFVGLFVYASKARNLQQKIIATQAKLPDELKPESLLAGRWQEIIQHIDSNREGEWKFAIIEAD